MARRVARGEIWLFRFAASDHRRPVLVLSRDVLLDVLSTATVAAVTSTSRGSPTEVSLGIEEGLKKESVVNMTNVFTVRQSDLKRFVGSVSPDKMDAVCEALSVALACDRS